MGFWYRKAQESQREMKLLLDMYRSAPKEQRDKVQLMAAEKKAKSEVETISSSICSLLEAQHFRISDSLKKWSTD